MAAFVEDLWNSIFTPGPTSTLLIATNVTFGALQVVLLALLIATYSIHFLILSILCGGLWGAINWFANELYAAQAQEEAAKQRKKDAGEESTDEGMTADETGAMDTGDDTEIEVDDVRSATRTSMTPMKSAKLVDTPPSPTQLREQETPKAMWNTSLAAQLAPAAAEPQDLRKRRTMADSNSSISTDSEWEKVEGEN